VLDSTYDFKAEDERLKLIIDEATKRGGKKTNQMNKTIRSTWVEPSIQKLDGSDNKFKTQAVWRASIDTDENKTNYKSIDQASGDANIAQDYNLITDSSTAWQSFASV